MFPDILHPKRLLPALVALFLLAAPLHAGELILTPSLAVREDYNDNIFSQTSGRRGDFITTLSPGLSASERTEIFNGNLAGGLNSLYYLRTSENDALGYFVQGAGNYTATPRLSLSANLGYTRDSGASYIDPVTLMVTSSRTLHQNYRLGGRYALTELLNSSFALGYGRDGYDNPAYLDTSHYQGMAGFDYDLGRRFPGIKLVQALTLNRDATDLSRVDSVSATLGLSKDLHELWRLSLNAGGRFTHSEFQAAGATAWQTHQEWGEVANISLAYSGERLSGALALSRDLVAASGRSGATQTTGVNLSLSEKFTRHLSGSLGAGYARNWAGKDQYAGQAIDERSRNLGGSLRYDFFDAPSDLSLEASYRYNYVEYRLSDTQMAQNIFMLRLNWQHPTFM